TVTPPPLIVSPPRRISQADNPAKLCRPTDDRCAGDASEIHSNAKCRLFQSIFRNRFLSDVGMSKNHNILSSFSKSINSFAANIEGILKPKPQPTPTMISFTTPSLLRRLHKPLALAAGLGLFALGANAQTTLLSHYTLDGNG